MIYLQYILQLDLPIQKIKKKKDKKLILYKQIFVKNKKHVTQICKDFFLPIIIIVYLSTKFNLHHVMTFYNYLTSPLYKHPQYWFNVHTLEKISMASLFLLAFLSSLAIMLLPCQFNSRYLFTVENNQPRFMRPNFEIGPTFSWGESRHFKSNHNQKS